MNFQEKYSQNKDSYCDVAEMTINGFVYEFTVDLVVDYSSDEVSMPFELEVFKNGTSFTRSVFAEWTSIVEYCEVLVPIIKDGKELNQPHSLVV